MDEKVNSVPEPPGAMLEYGLLRSWVMHGDGDKVATDLLALSSRYRNGSFVEIERLVRDTYVEGTIANHRADGVRRAAFFAKYGRLPRFISPEMTVEQQVSALAHACRPREWSMMVSVDGVAYYTYATSDELPGILAETNTLIEAGYEFVLHEGGEFYDVRYDLNEKLTGLPIYTAHVRMKIVRNKTS